MNNAMQEQLRQPTIRQTGTDHPSRSTIPSGFAELDLALPGGGWPESSLTEVLHDHSGTGDLRLLIPALARLSRSGRWIALIAPPNIPDAATLATQGVDLSRILLVHPRTSPNGQDTFRALEQALRCGTCAAVVGWLAHADERQLQRLQLAAKAGDAWGILFRGEATAHQPSPATLRLQLSHDTHGSMISLLEYSGNIRPQPLRLDLDHPRVRALPVSSAFQKPSAEEGQTMKTRMRQASIRSTTLERAGFPQMSLPLDAPEKPAAGQGLQQLEVDAPLARASRKQLRDLYGK